MTTTLHRLEESTYTDQHGFEHKCWRVMETVEVERTSEYESYKYYTETVKDWYWDSEDGRRWRCHTQTDFGGSASWSRRDQDGLRLDEHWIRDDRRPESKGKPHWHGLKPVVFDSGVQS